MDAALKCPRCGCGLSAERARLGPGIALENALERIESLPFTAKQREIARLMVDGYSNREIAERLKNTEQVINTYGFSDKSFTVTISTPTGGAGGSFTYAG